MNKQDLIDFLKKNITTIQPYVGKGAVSHFNKEYPGVIDYVNQYSE